LLGRKTDGLSQKFEDFENIFVLYNANWRRQKDFEFRAAFSPFVVNRASKMLAQQQLLLDMEHALTPVLNKIFKPLMLICEKFEKNRRNIYIFNDLLYNFLFNVLRK
jgi:hypothetical protein